MNTVPYLYLLRGHNTGIALIHLTLNYIFSLPSTMNKNAFLSQLQDAH